MQPIQDLIRRGEVFNFRRVINDPGSRFLVKICLAHRHRVKPSQSDSWPRALVPGLPVIGRAPRRQWVLVWCFGFTLTSNDGAAIRAAVPIEIGVISTLRSPGLSLTRYDASLQRIVHTLSSGT